MGKKDRMGHKKVIFALKIMSNGASPISHVVQLGKSFACICCGPHNFNDVKSYALRKLDAFLTIA